MKKILNILIIIISTFILTKTVDAASFSASASTTSVKPNGTFTISVGGDSIGRVDLAISNGTLSTSSVWVEQNYQTITVTAGSAGNVTITATPVTGYSDSDANIYNPGSRTIVVAITNPQTTPSTPQTPSKPITPTPGVQKSNDANLATLDINSGTLAPTFDAAITKYTVNLSEETSTLTVVATASHTKAKINGVGEVKLKPGLNNINVTVTAENGTKKTYTIEAYVDEQPKTYLKYEDSEIGLVVDLRQVELAGFDRETSNINDDELTVFRKGDLALVYGIDSSSHKNFYVLNEQEGILEHKLTPISISNRTFFVIEPNRDEPNRTLSTITIDNEEIEAHKLKNNFYLIRCLDELGRITHYVYESEEGTIQKYVADFFEMCSNENNTNVVAKIVILAESTFIVLLIGLTIKLSRRLAKEKRHEKNR